MFEKGRTIPVKTEDTFSKNEREREAIMIWV